MNKLFALLAPCAFILTACGGGFVDVDVVDNRPIPPQQRIEYLTHPTISGLEYFNTSTGSDLHFTTAATDLFGPDRVPHYVGPALPPGRDFRGIVQLHGSLGQRQDQLVLTDRNFGAAYMAEGWAARFLVGVMTTFPWK